MSVPNPADKKWVTTKNGERTSPVLPTQQEAQEEAKKQQGQVGEAKGKPQPIVESKQNLFG